MVKQPGLALDNRGPYRQNFRKVSLKCQQNMKVMHLFMILAAKQHSPDIIENNIKGRSSLIAWKE